MLNLLLRHEPKSQELRGLGTKRLHHAAIAAAIAGFAAATQMLANAKSIYKDPIQDSERELTVGNSASPPEQSKQKLGELGQSDNVMHQVGMAEGHYSKNRPSEPTQQRKYNSGRVSPAQADQIHARDRHRTSKKTNANNTTEETNSARALPPAPAAAVQVESPIGADSSDLRNPFIEILRNYFDGLRNINATMQIFSNYRTSLGGPHNLPPTTLPYMTSHPGTDEWIEYLFASMESQSPAAVAPPWQVKPLFVINFQNSPLWWSEANDALNITTRGFNPTTSVGLSFAPVFVVGDKWSWWGYDATATFKYSF